MAAAAKGAASGVRTAAKTVSPKSRANIGLQKVVPVSPQLGKFLGASEASRTDAIKKVWEHIKLHNLQVSIISYLCWSMLLYIYILIFIFCGTLAFSTFAIPEIPGNYEENMRYIYKLGSFMSAFLNFNAFLSLTIWKDLASEDWNKFLRYFSVSWEFSDYM